jgi:hypothetical protein
MAMQEPRLEATVQVAGVERAVAGGAGKHSGAVVLALASTLQLRLEEGVGEGEEVEVGEVALHHLVGMGGSCHPMTEDNRTAEAGEVGKGDEGGGAQGGWGGGQGPTRRCKHTSQLPRCQQWV